FSLSLLGLLYAKFPRPLSDPSSQAARTLPQSASGGSRRRVLLGEHWSVYRLAALPPPGALTPLEADFDEDPRMPFTRSALQPGVEVVVIHGDPRLGSPDAPSPQLAQYGLRLRLIEARAWTSAGFTLSRYQVAAPGELTGRGL